MCLRIQTGTEHLAAGRASSFSSLLRDALPPATSASASEGRGRCLVRERVMNRRRVEVHLPQARKRRCSDARAVHHAAIRGNPLHEELLQLIEEFISISKQWVHRESEMFYDGE